MHFHKLINLLICHKRRDFNHESINKNEHLKISQKQSRSPYLIISVRGQDHSIENANCSEGWVYVLVYLIECVACGQKTP